MSNTTPYRIRVAGYVLNTTSLTAPSLTDPSLNTAYKNQVVTVGTDSYFVDATGKAIKLGGGGAPEAVTYGTAAPTSTTALAGDRYFRTTDGTRAGEILEEYIFDGTGWQRMETHRQNFITALRPMYYNGAWVDAQANTITNAADAVRVTYQDGTTEYLKYGKFTWTGHGLTVGANYWLDKNVAGGITSTPPVEGDVDQAVLFVHDADTIEVSLQQAVDSVSTTPAIGSMLTRFVNRGVDVVLGDLKVRVPAAGSTLQIATVSGAFTAQLATEVVYNTTSTGTLHQVRSNVTVNTTYQTVDTMGYALANSGAVQHVEILDSTNLRRYRLTLQLNPSYANNAITIERIA